MTNWKASPEHAAASLRADYLIGGTVLQVNGRLQLSIELIDANDGIVVWAEQYRRPVGDLFSIQDDLSHSIAGAVEPGAMAYFIRSLRNSPIESLSQWEVLARGTHELYDQIGTGWKNHRAQDHFEAALLRDQDCAAAYAGLAYSLCLQVKENLAEDADRALIQALEMARHAVALDEHDPWCRVVLGRILQQMECYQDSITIFQSSLSLCPSSAKAHFGIAFGLTAAGQYKQAKTAMNEALRLSPRDPMAWSFMTVRTLAELYSEDFEAADKSARLARNLPNASHWAQIMHIPALVNLGFKQEAAFLTEQVRGTKPGLSAAMVRQAFPSQKTGMDLPVFTGLIEAGVPK